MPTPASHAARCSGWTRRAHGSQTIPHFANGLPLSSAQPSGAGIGEGGCQGGWLADRRPRRARSSLLHLFGMGVHTGTQSRPNDTASPSRSVRSKLNRAPALSRWVGRGAPTWPVRGPSPGPKPGSLTLPSPRDPVPSQRGPQTSGAPARRDTSAQNTGRSRPSRQRPNQQNQTDFIVLSSSRKLRKI